MNLKLKKPCANCPFLKHGAIELHPGRIEQICDDLYKHDRAIFTCHKTVYSEKKMEHSACMGALAWGMKIGRLPVSARFALSVGLLSADALKKMGDEIIDYQPKGMNK